MWGIYFAPNPRSILTKMEHRKIIEFGKSSHVVSLPKKWMEDHKLTKGAFVTVEEAHGKLMITPKKPETAEPPRRTEIDVTNKSIFEIKLLLISKYIQNYKEITLTSKSMSANSKEIRALVHDLMALEVVEETAIKIVTRDFLNMDEIDPYELLKKMDALTREMLADTRNTFKEDKSANIAERDGDVNRLFYLIRRSLGYIPKNPHLVRKLGFTHEEMMILWDIASYVEDIADETKRVAKLMGRLKMNDREKKEFTALFSLVEKYYLKAMELYYARDTKGTTAEIVRASEIMKKCQDYYRANWHMDWMPVIIECMKTIIGSTQASLMDLSDVEFSLTEKNNHPPQH